MRRFYIRRLVRLGIGDPRSEVRISPLGEVRIAGGYWSADLIRHEMQAQRERLTLGRQSHQLSALWGAR